MSSLPPDALASFLRSLQMKTSMTLPSGLALLCNVSVPATSAVYSFAAGI
jgi:hypothetical protein